MNTNNSLSGASDVRPKLSALIKDMCPHGVEFKTLGEVCIVKTAPMKLDKKEYQEQGLYPIVDQGQKFIVGYTDNVEALVPADDYVIFGDHTREIKYVDFTFAQGADGVKILKTKNEILPRFLYHVLKNTQIPSRGYNRHWTIAKDIEIPLPPLEIQEKIVECLDKFSALAAELQAELQMRRKQYEYYRTHLLTPHSDCNSADKTDDCNWEIKKIGEICTILRGKRLTKSELSEDEKYPVFHGGIEPLGYYKKHNREADTVMIINVGASAGTVGYSDKEFWSSDGCYCLSKSDSAIPKFMYYQLQKRESELKSRVRYAGIPTLDSDVIKKMQIALPPLAEQARIVSILDKFEKLITSMEEGIPAEQIRQQKRYEYYRDLLLTFDRKTV